MGNKLDYFTYNAFSETKEGKELKIMVEKKTGKSEDQGKDKGKKVEEKLPHCTTAPSAEHTRAHDGDEPCDDSRAG